MYNDQTLKDILLSAKTIASVGLSSNVAKVSYGVGAYLQEQGYHVVPVNPMADEMLGEKAYADLESIPGGIDVVQIFRRPEDIPPIVESAIKVGAKVIWMQMGITNEEAARTAREAGLQIVMDRCMREEHRRLLG